MGFQIIETSGLIFFLNSMYDYIRGQLTDLTPSYAVVENRGFGYFIHISLHTYSQLRTADKDCQLFLHQSIKEDAHDWYGFADRQERHLFRHLITVSKIGGSTARMMLSSYAPVEIQQAIVSGDTNKLKQVKGIGLKTAQRIIIELRDKLGELPDEATPAVAPHQSQQQEAVSALQMLGFAKAAAEKAVEKIVLSDASLPVEDIIKQALKAL